ncbi:hypothetical protein NKG94_27225 [Micromonospora sp. M12]
MVHPDLDSSKAVDDLTAERTEVDRLIDELGWQVGDDIPGRDRLAQVLAALRQLGCSCGAEFFHPYAQLAEQYADRELSLLPHDGMEVERAAAVARAVLLDAALAALRAWRRSTWSPSASAARRPPPTRRRHRAAHPPPTPGRRTARETSSAPRAGRPDRARTGLAGPADQHVEGEARARFVRVPRR